MRDITRETFAKKWLPPILYRKMLTLNAKISYFKFPEKNILKRNLELKSFRKSEDAYLIATGPSLKEIDFNKLVGKDCFTVSNAYLHSEFHKLNPVLHFFADVHSPLIEENVVEWFKEADSKIPKNIPIIHGFENKSIIEKNALFLNRNIYYLLSHPNNGFQFDITKQLQSPQTVPLLVIPVLINMGYKRIHLIGCDHNVLKNFASTIEHFYTAEADKRVNSSDKGAWRDIIGAHYASVRVFEQYKSIQLKVENEKLEVELFNSSKSSWLDFIPFKEL